MSAVNVSEGRRADVIEAVAGAAGDRLLDVHSDRHHHRSVLTVAGEDGVRAVAAEAVARIDLRRHTGVHPRLGAVDVVPFVPVEGDDLAEARQAAAGFAEWAGSRLRLPAFLYGERLSLPEVRRGAFRTLAPAAGPGGPHPRAGAVTVGARRALVAYNVWLAEPDLRLARRLAAALRGPEVRALGLAVGDAVQVSMNLVEPLRFGPADAYDAVAARAPVARAELVGLMPAAVLDATPPGRWVELDIDAGRTVEARLAGRDT